MPSAFVVPDTFEVDPDGYQKNSDKADDSPIEWEYSDEVDAPEIDPEGSEKYYDAVYGLFQSEGSGNRCFEDLVEADAELDLMVLGDDEKSGEGADEMDQIEKLDNGYLPIAIREVCIDNLRMFYIGCSVYNS